MNPSLNKQCITVAVLATDVSLCFTGIGCQGAKAYGIAGLEVGRRGPHALLDRGSAWPGSVGAGVGFKEVEFDGAYAVVADLYDTE